MSNKRANALDHGRREEEYVENPRLQEPIDPVRKATAAQLAARKIKAPKRRLAPGSSVGDGSGGASNPSNPFAFGLSTTTGADSSTSNFNFGQQSTQSVPNFSATTPTSFNFGQSTPAPGGFGAATTSTNSPSVFGFQAQQNRPSSPGIGAFGSGTPSQAPASNETSNFFNFQPQSTSPSGGLFANQSFPAFGANNNTAPSTPGNVFTNSSFPPPSGGNTTVGTGANSTSNNIFGFGSGNNAASSSASPSFSFGGNNKDTTPAPTSTPNKAFAFGSGNNDTSSGLASTSFGFGSGSKDTASGSASTPFAFGAGNKDETPAPASTTFSFGASKTDVTPAAATSTPFAFGAGNKDTASSATPTTSNIFSSGAGTKDIAAASSPTPSNLFNKPSTSTFSNIMKEVTSGDTSTTSNFFGNSSSQAPSNNQQDAGFAASVPAFGHTDSSSGPTNPPVPAFGSSTAAPSSATSSNLFSKSTMPSFGNNTNDTGPAAPQNTFAQSSFPTFGSNQTDAGTSLFNAGQAAPQPSSASPSDSINTTSAPQGSLFNNFAKSQPVSHAASDGAGASAQNSNNLFSFGQSQPAPNQKQNQFGASTQRNGLDLAQSQSGNTPTNGQPNSAEQPTDGTSLQAQAQELLNAKAVAEQEYAQGRANLAQKESQLAENVTIFRRSAQELEAKDLQMQTREHDLQVGRQGLEAEHQRILSVLQLQQLQHQQIEAEREALRLANEAFEARKRSIDQGVQTDEMPLKPLSQQEAQTDKSTAANTTDTDTATFPIPPIPRAYLSKEMKEQRPNITNINPNLSEIDKNLVRLCAELTMVNKAFRGKIGKLDEYADWSALSRWHLKESKELMAKIKAAKKERARLNGITGTESALSSKRKATEDAEQSDQTTTPKKARAFAPLQESAVSYTPKADPPSTSALQASTPFGFTPEAAPAAKDTSQTANLFGNILNKPTNRPLFPNAPVSDPQNDASSPFGSGQPATTFGGSNTKNDTTPAPSPSGFKVSTPSASNAKSFGTESASGFKPSTAKDSPASAGFKPSGFKPSSSTAASSMVNAFAQQAKTAEQLAAERKKKAKDEDYDSDEETYDEWSARYDKEQAAKKEEEAKKQQSTQGFKGFSLSTAGSTASSPFDASRNASGATSVFTSGAASPAQSATGGLSVFHTPSAEPSPGSNIFGHLSSNASSNNQDESDEEEQGNEEEGQNEEEAGQSEDEDASNPANASAESPKKDDTKEFKPSLLSRITRDPPSEEASNVNAAAETPQNKFKFFDFANAGSKTAPPKPSTFAGDQTYKPGTDIKFATSTTESGITNKPLFNFQPATPSSTEAGAKPPPFSLFSSSAGAPSKPSFLAPSAGQSGPGSVASSVFSSRATTPLSDAGVSDQGSAAQDGNDEEGAGGPQLDLSDLTDEEKKDYEVLFHAKMAIAKKQDSKDKTWKNFAKAPLWILKNKESGKALVRMRLPSGATPVNFNILPKIASSVAGKSKTMIMASRPEQDGKISSIYLVVKTADEAVQFSSVFNANMPSA